MRRRVLLCFVLAAASGCQGDDATKPITTSAPPPPSKIISDGNHSNGNPNFFFLPPMVSNPSGSPNWDANGFDGSFTGARAPLVSICRLDATTAAAVPTSICTSDVPVSSVAAAVDVAGQTYQLNWKVPDVGALTFYRVTVVLLTNQLGLADLEVVPNASALKNLSADAGLVPMADNRTLPIKFRIEQGALKVAVVTVNLAEGGTVSTTFPGSDLPSGITIPKEPDASTPLATITVSSCDDLHGRATDLPTFGHCIRVTSDQGTQSFTEPAVVFDCGADEAVHEAGLTFTQERRVTLHRFDAGVAGKPDRLAALPHAPACNPATHISANTSVRGMLANIAHGHFGTAARQVFSFLSPKPAYAAMFIDLGGGGFTNELSDFQFALPAKMKIVDGLDGRFATAGTPVHASVLVTDLGDEPVSGAVVHFFTGNPAVSGDVTAVSSPTGIATIQWGITPGENSMVASGRGIAGPDHNGPRGAVYGDDGSLIRDAILDPFQATQPAFDGADVVASGPVPVLIGSVHFVIHPAVLIGSSAGGTSLRGVTEANPGSLFGIDYSSGHATLIGSTGINGADGVPELSALAYDYNSGILYGVAGSACTGAQLITIDPSTGTGTSVGTMSGAGFDGSSGPQSNCAGGADALAFAPDGSLYASGWNGGVGGGRLLKIDKSTGVVLSAVATTGSIHISGLAFDASGALWASQGGNGTGQIHKLNPATGVVLVTIALKSPSGALESGLIVSDLAFGDAGVLYATLPSENTLATIDPVSGVVTRIGSFGTTVSRMSGLTAR